MTRPPAETISQQDLILRLRLLIDGLCAKDPWVCNHSRCWYALAELLILALENPRSITSRKVTYNIGRARTARMVAIMHDRPTRDGAVFSNSMRTTR